MFKQFYCVPPLRTRSFRFIFLGGLLICSDYLQEEGRLFRTPNDRLTQACIDALEILGKRDIKLKHV